VVTRSRPGPVDSSRILLPGPWRHRFVAANGARFHVVEAEGAAEDAPLVLLLHGFPQFWWAWRHQLVALAGRGHRVAAMDLRGYGASDKPPRGYDTPTLAADVAGVVRSLGAPRAVVVGQDWGAWIAWSMPALQPAVTRAVACFGMGHPLVMHAGAPVPHRLTRLSHVVRSQLPVRPERRLRDPAVVAGLLRGWAAPGWPGPEELDRYTEALRVPSVAHSALEYVRWSVRSLPRQDGRRFAAAVRAAIDVPVLQVHGEQDSCVGARTARASARWVRGSYRWELVDGAGHFVPEEAPERATALLAGWLATLAA
jgi:pimeloyl-ACP methyl ester carboxylesterase